MKITNLQCMVISALRALLVRIDTDEGISGLAQVEASKHAYLTPHVLFYRPYLMGQDPTNVERVMLRIRRFGAFKPWGSGVSAIEMALWDIAGKAAGVPVYKLLGGKIRDRVRVYNGGDMPYTPSGLQLEGQSPEDYFRHAKARRQLPGGFTIMKWGIGFHSRMAATVPGYHYGETPLPPTPPYLYQTGLTTEQGVKHTVACVTALKEALGDEVGLALDCGPGWQVPAAIRLAKALEPLNVLWLEDLITGDYTPYTLPKVYRRVTQSTTTPIHTGEQIYLRQGFQDLIETHAVDIIGPDPCDIGGLMELKWVAEYANLHGILIAPHGVGDGPIGLHALLHVCATLPQNYIAFELPIVDAAWRGLVKGLPENAVRDGFMEVPDTPGMGIELNEPAVRRHLNDGEAYFDDS